MGGDGIKNNKINIKYKKELNFAFLKIENRSFLQRAVFGN
jgi:hypothetical protein